MFRNTRNGAWYFHLFQSLFQFCLETTETLNLANFLHVSVRFNNFPIQSYCFNVSKHQIWGLVVSPFPELVSILFQNFLKQLKLSDLSGSQFFFMFQSISIISIYNLIVSMFGNTRYGAWYFHFFQILFQFCFEKTETFGLSQFSSCFSPFQ